MRTVTIYAGTKQERCIGTGFTEREVRRMSREECIRWLVNMDPNGCYSDEDVAQEYNGDIEPLTEGEARAHVYLQANDIEYSDEGFEEEAKRLSDGDGVVS
jgi:hypothetical protein